MLAMLELRIGGTATALQINATGGWPFRYDDLAYIRKRRADEEAERLAEAKRLQEQIEEEAARIAREEERQRQEAISKIGHEADRVRKRRAIARSVEADRLEREQLDAHLERLQASINAQYRSEREARRSELKRLSAFDDIDEDVLIMLMIRRL